MATVCPLRVLYVTAVFKYLPPFYPESDGEPMADNTKQWKEEGVAPQVVFEIWSPGNRLGEMTRKFNFYQRYGVEEFTFMTQTRAQFGAGCARATRSKKSPIWPVG
jgi:Uma2 family endonuclease